MPRGIRNNNPGNLIYNAAIQWNGQTGSDGRYAMFNTAVNGIRALMLDIWNDYYKDGKQSLRALIAEYAPPIENATDSYLDDVSARTLLKPDQSFLWRQEIIGIARAIVHHENGYDPYPITDYQAALAATGKA